MAQNFEPFSFRMQTAAKTAVCQWNSNRITVPNGAVGLDGRGGATISSSGTVAYIFGGADRNRTHFSDLWKVDLANSESQL